jgi:large subunit ribosomal protein L7/L12
LITQSGQESEDLPQNERDPGRLRIGFPMCFLFSAHREAELPVTEAKCEPASAEKSCEPDTLPDALAPYKGGCPAAPVVRPERKSIMVAHSNGVFPLDMRELADHLASLTLAQAAELRAYLEEVHGIRPAPGPIRVKPADEPAPPPPPGPTHFSVVLEKVTAPEKKIGVFKAVRETTGLGLKETRELVDGTPAVVKTDLPEEEAAALKKKLESAGARVTLAPVRPG